MLTIRISRSDEQWVADIREAKGFIATSPSLERLRKQVDKGLAQFYPKLAKGPRRELFDLPEGARNLLSDVARAERAAEKAQERASALKRNASKRLRAKLGISVREVGALMGISGARVQQLLKE
jgi:hypothetical protein